MEWAGMVVVKCSDRLEWQLKVDLEHILLYGTHNAH